MNACRFSMFVLMLGLGMMLGPVAAQAQDWVALEDDWVLVNDRLTSDLATLVSATSSAEIQLSEFQVRLDQAAYVHPECTELIAAAEAAVAAYEAKIIAIQNTVQQTFDVIYEYQNDDMCSLWSQIEQQNANDYNALQTGLYNLDGNRSAIMDVLSAWLANQDLNFLTPLAEAADDAITELEGGC